MFNGIRLEMDTFVPGDEPTVKTYLLLELFKRSDAKHMFTETGPRRLDSSSSVY